MERRCNTSALSWEDTKDIIDSQKLEELGRSAAQHAHYRASLDSIMEHYASIGDYIKISKLDVESCDDGSGKLASTGKRLENARTSSLVLLKNDFPYHFESNIQHYVLWKYAATSDYGIGISDCLSTAEIEWGAQQLSESLFPLHVEIQHWINPEALKSIPDVDHCHFVVRVADATEIFQHLLLSPHEEGYRRAAEMLALGELVAFPTETVYGLGANALDEKAVLSIFEAKGRPLTDPLIVHIADAASAAPLVSLTEVGQTLFEKLGNTFWPGPLTTIVRASSMIPPQVTAHTGFVGIRVPAHPIANQLLAKCGLPIAAPSANRFGHVSPTSASHVLADLGTKGVHVINGEFQSSGTDDKSTLTCEYGIESTVLRIDEERKKIIIFRQGAVSQKQLQSALVEFFEMGWEIEAIQKHVKMEGSDKPKNQSVSETVGGQEAPGQAITHYAPDVPCYLMEMVLKAGEARGQDCTPILEFTQTQLKNEVAVLDFGQWANKRIGANKFLAYRDMSERGSTKEAAALVFDCLRWAETLSLKGAKFVLLAPVENSVSSEDGFDLTLGLVDRMNRATSGRKIRLRVV